MSDIVKEAEVVSETALIKPDNLFLGLLKEQDRPILQVVEGLATLDWHDLRPHQTALLLMQKPMAVSGGGTMYLTFRQAIYFAVRCYELGLSPFSGEVWFDASRFSVNLTLEGKRALARNKGIDLGPPEFEELSKEWKDLPRMTPAAEDAKKVGFTKDVGVKCTIRVGDPKLSEHVNFTAWLSEWFVSRSPVWQAKPLHMLTIRANEKAVTLALGTGISAMPDERELE